MGCCRISKPISSATVHSEIFAPQAAGTKPLESPPLSSSQRRFIIVWFDEIALTTNNNRQKMKTELEQMVDTVIIFDDANKCVDYINNIKDVTILLIVDEMNGGSVVRSLFDFSKIKSIYILCTDRSTHVPWTTGCKQVNCISTDISSICERIEMSTRDNSISFSISDGSFISSSTIDANNKQEVMFMYGQLLKQVLTKMDYAADDMDEMIEFLKNKCKDQPKDIEDIEKLKNNYASETPIFWYSKYTFLYVTLNSALRTRDVSVLWSMRVFIKDLHQQIVKLYTNTTQTKDEKLYRGVRISTSAFKEMNIKKGRLLSNNNFLSTSFDKDVAAIFAGADTPLQNDTSLFFVITINQSILRYVDFARIQSSQHSDEEECLFTMGSVFRIESIEQSDENGTWLVHLTLIADPDSELNLLANSILPEGRKVDLITLCMIMFYMGEYEKVLEIGETAIKTSNDASYLYGLYQMLGSAYLAIGYLQQGLEKFQLASDYYRKLSGKTGECMSESWAKALVFSTAGNLDLAMENLVAVVSNKDDYQIIEESTEVLVGCYIMLGMIFYRQGRFSDAILYQEQASNIAKERLPPIHPLIGECLDQIVTSYMLEGRMDDAFLCLQESIEIKKRSSPPEHLKSIQSQGTFDYLRYSRDNRPKSQFQCDCLSAIQQKWLSDPRDNPVKLLIQGRTYVLSKNFDEALSVLNQYVSIQKKNLPFQHPDLVLAYVGIGHCHLRKHNLPEALQNVQQGYEIALQHFERTSSHPIIFFCLLSILTVYAEQGNYEDALTTFEQCQTLITDKLNNMIKYFGIDPLTIIITRFRERAYDHALREEYDDALLRFQNCLKIQMQFLPSDHPDLGTIYEDMANIFIYMKEYSNALINYQNTQKIWQKSLPENDPKLAQSWKDCGYTYQLLCQYDDALTAYNKHLQIQLTFLPPDHLDLADAYSWIGKILVKQGNYSDAIDNYKHALTIRQKHLSSTDPKIADSCMQYGLVYNIMGQYDNSLFAFNEALDILLNVSPSNYIDIAFIYKGIGSSYFESKKYDDALLYFQKCLDIQTNFLSADLPDIADTLVFIGDVFFEEKKFSDALDYYQRALDIRRKCLPSTDLSLAKSCEWLAIVHSMLGCYDESLTAYNECLKIQSNTLPSEHIELAVTHKKIASIYLKIEKYEDALSSFQKCLDIQKISLPTDHPDLADTFANIGDILFEQKEFPDALINCQHALDIRCKCLPPPTDPIMRENWASLGLIHHALKHYDELLKCFRKYLSIQTSLLPIEYPVVAGVYNLMGNIFFTKEELSDALDCYQRALDIYLQCPSSTVSQIASLRKNLGDVYISMNNYERSLFYYYEFFMTQCTTVLPVKVNFAIKQIIEEIYFAKHAYENDLLKWQDFLNFQTKSLPLDHPHLAPTYIKIGNVLLTQQDFSAALDNYRSALDILHKYVSSTNSQIEEISVKIVNSFLVDIYIRIGMILSEQQKFSDAFHSCQRAVDILLKCSAALSPEEIAQHWCELGYVYITMSNYERSLFAFNQYFANEYTTSSSADIDVRSKLIIESVYFAIHHYEDDLSKWQDFLKFQLKSLPPSHSHLASTYTHIGDVFRRQNMHSNALDSYQHALNILLEYFSTTNPKINEIVSEYDNYTLVSTYFKVGDILSQQEKWSDALDNYQHALNRLLNSSSTTNSIVTEIMMKYENICLTDIYTNIGNVLYEQNKFPEAIENYQHALDVRRNCSSPTDPVIAKIWKCIGRVYVRMSKYDSSLFAYNTAYAIEHTTLSPAEIDSTSQSTIRQIYFEKHQYADDLTKWQDLLSFQMSSLPADHHHLAFTYAKIGDVFYGQENLSDALQNYQRALDIQNKSVPSSDLQTAEILMNLGKVYSSMKQFEESLSNLKKCLVIQRSLLPPERLDLAITSLLISGVLLQQSNLSECKVYLQDTLNIILNSHPSNEQFIVIISDLMGQVNFQLCLYDEALSAYKTCLDIQKKYLSSDHVEILRLVERISEIEQIASSIERK